jgi:hypothetical protein
VDLGMEEQAGPTRYPFESGASEVTEFFRKAGHKRDMTCPHLELKWGSADVWNHFMEPFVFTHRASRREKLPRGPKTGKRGDDLTSSTSTPAHTTDKWALTRYSRDTEPSTEPRTYLKIVL